MATVADVLDELPNTATFEEMKESLKERFDGLSEGRATDLVADYMYVSQGREV